MTCCSIGAATVSATTLELAPGYVQLTCTVGGVISGYCATGRMKTAMLPASVMMTEITAAKIGRLIKNFATLLALLSRWPRLALRGRCSNRSRANEGPRDGLLRRGGGRILLLQFGLHLLSGLHALQPFHNDAIARR